VLRSKFHRARFLPAQTVRTLQQLPHALFILVQGKKGVAQNSCSSRMRLAERETKKTPMRCRWLV
jgi:hypothetical protein